MSIDLSTLNKTSSSTTSGGSSAGASDAASADRFLKLLVTQMQNQDPLNPMDNAQVTSQMAQINTVSGIQQLNTTVAGLNSQFVQMQALQGASLVGRPVVLEGNQLTLANGQGSGTFEMDSPADKVKVEILNASGRVVDTVDLGAETGGRHDFSWNASGVAADAKLTFRVTATHGTATVPTTALVRDKIDAVGIDGNTLTLTLEHSGETPYSKIKAFD
jgi:flagellar basal-body rod modification protein FlgD